MKKWYWIVSVFMMFGVMLSGCGSSGGGGSTNNTTSTYSLSGNITLGGSALAGVTVALTGATSASASTDASGNYSFSGLANGSYTVTPSKGGYTVTPSSKTVTVNSANVTAQDFTATATTGTTYSIGGQVTLSGSGLAGVTVALTGATSASANTDASGNYSFNGLTSGSYTVMPSKSGYTFTPTNKSVTVNSANVTAQNFTATTATATTYSITGQVTLSGSGLAGVTVALSSASSATVTTDAIGNYSFTGLANGSYTVTPSKSGYTFTPANKSVTVNSANVTAQNFTATAVSAGSSWSLLKLPDTGQTTHYSTAFGDDANYNSINSPSYTDNGNGTITDNVTTLMWQKQDDSTGRFWDVAGTYCTGLSLGGHADWRLPNDIELMSIVDYGKYNPASNTTYFPNTGFTNYWSSSTCADGTSGVWVVYFKTGEVTSYYKTIPALVRCVRGGQ